MLACHRAPVTTPRVDHAWLTGAAERSVDEQGQFILAHAPPGEVTEEMARSLAMMYLTYFGPWHINEWSDVRGEAIELESLTPCGRAFHAASPYKELPPVINRQLRAHVGPRWMIFLCSGNVPRVSLAVSALATDLQVGVGPISGLFIGIGIPSFLGTMIMSPEEAARLVFEQTGRQIVEAPELVRPPVPYSPHVARWRFTLEAPVTLRGRDGHTFETTTVYMGSGNTYDWRGLQGGDPSRAGPQSYAIARAAHWSSYRSRSARVTRHSWKLSQSTDASGERATACGSVNPDG